MLSITFFLTEGAAYGSFVVDGVEKACISGYWDRGWWDDPVYEEVVVDIGPGVHALKWMLDADTGAPTASEWDTCATLRVDELQARNFIKIPSVPDMTFNGSVQVAEIPVSGEYNVITNDGGKNVGRYSAVLKLVDPVSTRWNDGEDGDCRVVSFSILPKMLTDEMVVLSDEAFYYDPGSTVKKPSVTVADTNALGVVISTANDYMVAYEDATAAGAIPVTVTAKNNYFGTVTKTFPVLKRPVAPPVIGTKAYNGRKQKATVPVDDRWTVGKNDGGINVGEYEVVDAAAGLEGFLGYLGGRLVAYVGVEGGDDAYGVLHHFVAMVGVDGDALDALGAQGVDGVAQPGDALEYAFGDDGLHDVELELAGLGCECYGGVVAYHLEADLVGHFGDDGIHLTGHDGGTGSHGGQVDFMKAAPGAGSHETQVVAGLGELDGEALEGCGIGDVCAGVGGGLHEVGGERQGVAAELAHALGAELGEAGDRIQAGADGGAAHVDFAKKIGVALEICDFFLKVVRKGVEFLAGSHGDCVLKLGAAHLEHVLELLTLGAESCNELLEAVDEVLVHPHESVAEG